MAPIMPLGKLPAVKDDRTFKMSALLRALLPPPETFNGDDGFAFPLKDEYTFGNDVWNNCVVAMKAHGILRMEGFEQKKQLPVKDSEVLADYWLEQGAKPYTRKFLCKTVPGWDSKPNRGLVMLDSLNYWRKTGIQIGSQTYKIYGYGALDPKDRIQVMNCICLLRGIYVGLQMPASAMEQWARAEPWTVMGGSRIEGGHAVYIPSYRLIPGLDTIGPVCCTWGEEQPMTWEFFEAYADEVFGILDNKDTWLGDNSPVDIPKLESLLSAITS